MGNTGKITESCKRAMEKLNRDDQEGALSDFMTVMQSQATTAKEYYFRASVKQISRNLKGAIEDFTTAIELDTLYSMAYYSRAICRLLIDDKKDNLLFAVEDYNKAVELNPEINKKKF